jgi:RimJ/RimL family protein N-acetyltransferase
MTVILDPQAAPTPSVIDPDTGLPIGPEVDPTPADWPKRTVLEGQYVRLEPIAERHIDDLFRVSTVPDAAKRFRYLFDTVPLSREDMAAWVFRMSASEDPFVFAVMDKASGRAEGRQSFMRITPAHRSIEIGNIYWGPAIAGTRAATEAQFLFAKYAFEVLGYRRYEWKCDALNEPSRNAAIRFGFTFEGLFRRAVINKGRSRDTAWYAMIEEEWPALKQAYLAWLDPANFDADGVQKRRLSDLTRAALLCHA